MAFNDLRRANTKVDDYVRQSFQSSDEFKSALNKINDTTLVGLKKGNLHRKKLETQMIKERMKDELDYDKVMRDRHELGFSEME